MEIWKIVSVFAILAVFVIGTAFAATDFDTITATVTVPTSCTVSLNTTTINFGSVAAGADTGSANQVVSVTNTGNTATTTTTISGTGWTGSPSGSMVVGQTEYETSGFVYGSNGTTLTSSPVDFGSISASGSQNLFFGVGVPAAQTAATYTQTITVTMNC